MRRAQGSLLDGMDESSPRVELHQAHDLRSEKLHSSQKPKTGCSYCVHPRHKGASMCHTDYSNSGEVPSFCLCEELF